MVLTAACIAALVTNVPVSISYSQSYTVGFTTVTVPVDTIYTVPNDTLYVPLRTTTWTATGVLAEVTWATATSTILAPFLEVLVVPSLQPYACTHLNLTGAIFYCIMQFWGVLIVPLIVVVGLLVYSLVKRRKTQASKLET